ncbi:uncharacterized protein LOC119649410 [Hermetia illucens]|uniref:uncharacterized protein LOC119649410 n=1 Tax=Hermetia illucens TaxID=343691 RepID=UPI0018CC5F95|nr:uncharacterized protein LOC119649410 [Hermetia illucens]
MQSGVTCTCSKPGYPCRLHKFVDYRNPDGTFSKIFSLRNIHRDEDNENSDLGSEISSNSLGQGYLSENEAIRKKAGYSLPQTHRVPRVAQSSNNPVPFQSTINNTSARKTASRTSANPSLASSLPPQRIYAGSETRNPNMPLPSSRDSDSSPVKASATVYRNQTASCDASCQQCHNRLQGAFNRSSAGAQDPLYNQLRVPANKGGADETDAKERDKQVYLVDSAASVRSYRVNVFKDGSKVTESRTFETTVYKQRSLQGSNEQICSKTQAKQGYSAPEASTPRWQPMQRNPATPSATRTSIPKCCHLGKSNIKPKQGCTSQRPSSLSHATCRCQMNPSFVQQTGPATRPSSFQPSSLTCKCESQRFPKNEKDQYNPPPLNNVYLCYACQLKLFQSFSRLASDCCRKETTPACCKLGNEFNQPPADPNIPPCGKAETKSPTEKGSNLCCKCKQEIEDAAAQKATEKSDEAKDHCPTRGELSNVLDATLKGLDQAVQSLQKSKAEEKEDIPSDPQELNKTLMEKLDTNQQQLELLRGAVQSMIQELRALIETDTEKSLHLKTLLENLQEGDFSEVSMKRLLSASSKARTSADNQTDTKNLASSGEEAGAKDAPVPPNDTPSTPNDAPSTPNDAPPPPTDVNQTIPVVRDSGSPKDSLSENGSNRSKAEQTSAKFPGSVKDKSSLDGKLPQQGEENENHARDAAPDTDPADEREKNNREEPKGSEDPGQLKGTEPTTPEDGLKQTEEANE